MHTQQTLCHFGRPVLKAKLICQNHFRPGNQAGVFIWENFHPGCRDLGWRNRDLSNRAGPPSHMHEHIEIFTKELGVRRDLGNRVSPVNWAHMKRPLEVCNFSRLKLSAFTPVSTSCNIVHCILLLQLTRY